MKTNFTLTKRILPSFIISVILMTAIYLFSDNFFDPHFCKNNDNYCIAQVEQANLWVTFGFVLLLVIGLIILFTSFIADLTTYSNKENKFWRSAI